ncbi:MAG: endonuclease Q family protein [Candidatus Hodarchaeales archaeon]
MDVAVDLHAHSVFAGGTQSLKLVPGKQGSNRKKAIRHLIKTNETMPLKGIDIIGTGDCQFSFWTEILSEVLVEDKPGIFFLEDNYKTRFLLQTELIFTLPVHKRSKITHVLFLFPDFENVLSFRNLLTKWGVKHEKMARPFVKCESKDIVSKRINQILDLHPLIEAIPAHIMTPQGIYGSNIRINYLNDYFGDACDRINVLETGLSADPQFLGLIPELDPKTLISNSDAHSSALHRMGREFTVLELPKITFSDVIQALRNNRVKYTVEFPPEEGRFFLTGHRAGRKRPGLHREEEFCYFSPQHVPSNDICPICNKSLTVGVYQRCVEISNVQGENRRLEDRNRKEKYIRMVPLIDILSKALGVKTKTAKSLIDEYKKIFSIVGPETQLWKLSVEELTEQLSGKINENIINAIINVKSGDFTFLPYGYDGEYGELKLGKRGNFQNINKINSKRPLQKVLM